MRVSVQREDFDAAGEARALVAGRTDIGAVVTFTGLCRGNDGGDAIGAMTLETYEAMALAEIQRLAEEAAARWPLQGLTIIHRHGRMLPGDQIVLVITASAHRQAAFEAAEFLMDYLKTAAPFWKAEERADGRAWVAAKQADDDSAARWQRSNT